MIDQMKKRIIFTSGLTSPSFVLRFWREELERHYPDHDIVVLGRFYTYWSKKKIQVLTDTLRDLIEDEQETILMGYSYGGIISGAAMNTAKQYNVVRVVTVASPNNMLYLGMKKRMERIGYRVIDDPKIQKITFGSYIDPIVPFGYTHLPGEIHYDLWLDHFLFFWFSRKTIRKILTLVDQAEFPDDVAVQND